MNRILPRYKSMTVNHSNNDKAGTILIFDENPVWRELLRLYLEYVFFNVIVVSSGDEVLNILQDEAEKIDLVILDDDNCFGLGRNILQKIKINKDLCYLPVVMVTAFDDQEKFEECIRAGAYYFIAKPFSAVKLQCLISGAINQFRLNQKMNLQASEMRENFQAIEQVTFNFRTREQAQSICMLIADFAGLSTGQEMGLLELMINAVEHGNLAIGHHLKSKLISENRLDEEINSRLQMPQFANKVAILEFRRCSDSFIFTISDEGQGFDWQPYLNLQPGIISENNGRGIALANKLVFSNISYWAGGNIVEAKICLRNN